MSFNSMSFVKQLYLYFPVIYFFIAQINQALLCLGAPFSGPAVYNNRYFFILQINGCLCMDSCIGNVNGIFQMTFFIFKRFPYIYKYGSPAKQLLCLGIRQKRRILQSFKIYSGFCAEIMLCATVFCLDFINCNTMGRNYHTIFLLQFGFQIFMRPQISSRNHPAGKTQLFRGNCYLQFMAASVQESRRFFPRMFFAQVCTGQSHRRRSWQHK